MLKSSLSPLLRALLYLPAKIYEFIVRLRVVLYEQQYFKSRRLTKPVVSIGNITVGGTGKTPLVEFIARYLQEEHFEVAILSRGYQRKDSQQSQVVVSDGKNLLANLDEAGDEPFMLASKLAETKIIVDANRFRGGQKAEELGCDIVLLDDGFQHLQLHRDLNIVVLDGTDPFGGGAMVPFGKLREPIYGLRRAHQVVVTRADRELDQELIYSILSGLEMNIPVHYCYHEIVGLRSLNTGKPLALQKLTGTHIGAFCALGNPQVFLEDLAHQQAEIVFQQLFRDHHNYIQKDLDELALAAQKAGAEFLVTTEKDAVKLKSLNLPMAICVIEIKVFFEDEVKFKSALLRAITSRSR